MIVLSVGPDADVHEMHREVRSVYSRRQQTCPSLLTAPVLEWTSCQTGACLVGIYAGLRNNTLSWLRTVLNMAMCARGPWRYAAITDLTLYGRRFRYFLDMIQGHLAYADESDWDNDEKDRFIRRGDATFADAIVLDARLCGIANTIWVWIITLLRANH